MAIHLAFDILAYTLAAGMGFWAKRQPDSTYQYPVPKTLGGGYLLALTNGAIIGSIGLGTWNLQLSGMAGFGKSVLGALVGAIVAAELFKLFFKLAGSTGALLVPGLALGILVGRLGCFFGGLDDYTYGIVSTRPWAVDFGDGLPRHPVQLYESAAMALPLVLSCWWVRANNALWLEVGFYAFVVFYGLQRLCWEFLKPYPPLLLQLNLFQWFCIALVCYGLIMMKKRWP